MFTLYNKTDNGTNNCGQDTVSRTKLFTLQNLSPKGFPETSLCKDNAFGDTGKCMDNSGEITYVSTNRQEKEPAH